MERAAMLSLPRCPMKDVSSEWQTVPVMLEPMSRKVKKSCRRTSAVMPHRFVSSAFGESSAALSALRR